MPHYSVIDTRSAPGLLVTLRAITVCAWAQVADATHGVRTTTATLWRQYRLARAEERAWAVQHQAEPVPSDWPQAEQLDESALESLASAFGRPVWLTGSLLALVMAGALVDMVDGWPLLIDACSRIGAALASLARS